MMQHFECTKLIFSIFMHWYTQENCVPFREDAMKYEHTMHRQQKYKNIKKQLYNNQMWSTNLRTVVSSYKLYKKNKIKFHESK